MVKEFCDPGSVTDYREIIPGEVLKDEHLLSRLQQQCTPIPDKETAAGQMQQALGYLPRKNLSGQNLRTLAHDYLLALAGAEFDRTSQNSAIATATSVIIALRGAPATDELVDDILLAVHSYFWLENITAQKLLEGFEF
ncbi:hypothetical protein [Glutamicibacter sp. JC586]|uniref:hypothetical protein n=1 Tax=Glutamicibacter sp. JC586 TaxID=2590552 RepID=UPI001359507C|nr:hypothetical protein [Glutamicibacter sp. JC586]